MKKAALSIMFVAVAIPILSCTGGALSGRAPRPGNEQLPPNMNLADRRDSSSRHLQFSGYEWSVKSSVRRVGPGPNYFSDSNDNVVVDAEGRLHLLITQRDGQWYCAEVVSTRSFGYGTYRFHLETNPDGLDVQVVLGMFTWSNDPAYNHREIDIEISRWGKANNSNAQFVVQPYTRHENIVRFQTPTGLGSSTHLFTWKPNTVFFQSKQDSSAKAAAPNSFVKEYEFTEGIPQSGDENARINLWLFTGHPPTNGKEVEVIITKFEFIPLGQ
jgi:hypothetical protein